MKHGLKRVVVCLASVVMAAVTPACAGGGGGQDAGVDANDGDGGGDPGPKICVNHGDCPMGQICLGGLCTPGKPCNGPSDCPTGYTCSQMRNVCEPKPCINDTDCQGTPSTPHCLSSSQTCVVCTTDSQCSSDEKCDTSNYTCKPKNPPCTSDADCTADPSRHHCAPDGKCYGCVSNSHCTNGYVCEPGSHTCVQCTGPSQCSAPTPKCNTTTFTCVECTIDGDCSGGKHCNTSTGGCTMVTCTSDTDCQNEPGKPKCKTDTHDCVACLTSVDCGAGMFCRSYDCQAGCLTDQECVDKNGQKYHCNTQNHDCFYAECTTDPDCTGTAGKPHCKTNNNYPNPPQYTCVACTQDPDCPSGQECDLTKSTCRAKPCYRYNDPDATCEQIASCYRCDMASGLCKPGKSCPNVNDCCQGYTCDSYSSCQPNVNCTTDNDCPVGDKCNTSLHNCEWQSCCNPACQTGWYCDSGTCQCVNNCTKEGNLCDPTRSSCCQGLKCSLFGICTAI